MNALSNQWIWDSDYQKHIRKILDIQRERKNTQNEHILKYKQMSERLLRNREKARNFREQQLSLVRSRSDQKMRQNIQSLSSRMHNCSVQNSVPQSSTSSRNVN